ncbi:MAG: hypothetical protein ACTH83_06065, partial [Lactococcus cremoris]
PKNLVIKEFNSDTMTIKKTGKTIYWANFSAYDPNELKALQSIQRLELLPLYKVKVKSVPVDEKQQRELKLRELVGKQLSESFMSNLKPEFETDNFGNIKGICFRMDY